MSKETKEMLFDLEAYGGSSSSSSSSKSGGSSSSSSKPKATVYETSVGTQGKTPVYAQGAISVSTQGKQKIKTEAGPYVNVQNGSIGAEGKVTLGPVSASGTVEINPKQAVKWALSEPITTFGGTTNGSAIQGTPGKKK